MRDCPVFSERIYDANVIILVGLADCSDNGSRSCVDVDLAQKKLHHIRLSRLRRFHEQRSL